MRGYHDLGGLPSGPLNKAELEPALWEKRVESVKTLLHKSKLMNRDEFRRGIETLGSDVYSQLKYSERRIASISNILIEKGLITIEELGQKMAEVEERHKRGEL